MNTKRGQILKTALGLTEGDRNKTYGCPQRNLTVYAELVHAYIKGLISPDKSIPLYLTAVDGAILMVLAKISRIAVNPKHEDNYIDGAAYMAIAGECAEKLL